MQGRNGGAFLTECGADRRFASRVATCPVFQDELFVVQISCDNGVVTTLTPCQ